ncbi:exonuclease SbcCD subunit D C-terminal domain-containing protein [Massilia endophytica]|uniref:exonuclease SbcCD subunit D C-terminal domain-containing protein n=1 Tax=Massilia endophytica TaxID=2899220 RepID=UPI001E35D551|nr:exonuclease SbcCD subunit D C-terminal domain-containing protein [Massilia endophytica]UGQ44620.1 exonuclease SbcCD subunit D C-terminal domain-containing protein [Massilia endophytica]
MRLLHTSDWHLGQSLHNFDRHYEHQRFLDWLLDLIVSERADALLLAGDVFDNANPSAVSQRQFYRFLQQARERAPQLDLVIIAGNHDSPGRLEAPLPLLEAHGARVVGNVTRKEDGSIDVGGMVLPLRNGDGKVAAWCIAIPFLRPGDVPRVEAGEGEEAPDPYLAGIAELYRLALEHALSLRKDGQAIVAMGHCHLVEGQMSADSERRIVIGGTEMLPSGIFGPEIAYTALGHLHLAQGKQEHIRYCGSPIPLSFSETQYKHQVLCVELEGAALSAVRPVFVPRSVPLLRVPASPAPLEAVLAELSALELPECETHAQPYLEVRVRLDAPEPGLRARIEAAIEGKPLRLAKIETSSSARGQSLEDAAVSLDQLARLQPDEVFKRLYRQKYDSEAPEEQLQAFAELLLARE